MKNSFKTKMLQSAITLFFVLSLSSIAWADVPINIFPTHYQYAKAIDDNKIESIITDNLKLSENLHYKVNVKIIYKPSGDPDHLIVYILSNHTYLFETTRIDINDAYQVISIETKYLETEADYSQGDVEVYASCPDKSVEMVFSTCETGIQTAVAGINFAAGVAEDAGYNVEVLLGNAENRSAILNWLECDDLVYFGRIGHGSTTGIMVSNGTLSYNDFRNMPLDTLNSKVLYFNSCQVHNSPLQPAILNAGAQKYIGGIDNLYIGSSEEVFKCVATDAIQNHEPLTSTLADCEKTHYPYTGAHGISGNGSDYVDVGDDGLSLNDVFGQYIRQPPTNEWHTGTISMVGNSMQWENEAGWTWTLIPDLTERKLFTNKECPYFESDVGKSFNLILNQDETEVESFQFLGEFYQRQ
ncbi:MAG: hypothetical protein GY710_10390 [Desulfobacteraceae bacterium]|nr:hypothetical protein [Desulfobacteraceae bacterium]